MGVFKQFREDQSRILDAKKRTSENKVVLFNDFLVDAFVPAAEGLPDTESLFGVDAKKILTACVNLYRNVGLEDKVLPYYELKEQSKANIRVTVERAAMRQLQASSINVISYGSDEGTVADAVKRGGLILSLPETFPNDDPHGEAYIQNILQTFGDITLEPVKQKMMSEMQSGAHVCFEVSEIVTAMHHSGRKAIANGIARFHSSGFLRGQGAVVADFWEAVANLPDYSGSFPDKKPPSGNDRNKRRGVDLPGLLGGISGGRLRPLGAFTPIPVPIKSQGPRASLR